MKKKVFTMLLCIALVLPGFTVWAEEDEQRPIQEAVLEQRAPQETVQETGQENASQEQKSQETVQQKPAPKNTGGQLQIPKVKGNAGVWINRIIAYISQIGGLFGKTLGFRVGGTTGTAIAALLLAKFLENKAPPWVKYLLYATGGTMFAGSGANITQVLMQVIGG